jgi:hypothetical protein
MAALHETAYPRIKPSFSPKELKEVFTPTEEELSLLDSKTKKTLPVTRLGFMLALKCYQYLGRPFKTEKIDAPIKKYLAEKIGVDPFIDMTGYNKLTRHRLSRGRYLRDGALKALLEVSINMHHSPI